MLSKVWTGFARIQMKSSLPLTSLLYFQIKGLNKKQFFLFSSKKEQDDFWSDEEDFEPKKDGRKTTADKENPVLTKRKEGRSKLALLFKILSWSAFFIVCYDIYLLNTKERPEEELGAVPYAMDIAKYFDTKYHNFYNPPMEKLLPDFPYIPGVSNINFILFLTAMDPPKTLVLNLTGTLVHTDYVFGKGAVIIKRPGLNQLLNKLSQMYEIVIYTDDDTMKLDPKHMMFAGRFGQESTVFDGGEYIKVYFKISLKDLKYLNRSLKKIVVLDKNPKKLKYHTENGIFLPEFKGNSEDRALYELLPFLEYLARPDVKDVRNELKKYGNVEPGKAYLEEIMQRQSMMKHNKGIGGIFSGMASNQPKRPSYATENRFSSR